MQLETEVKVSLKMMIYFLKHRPLFDKSPLPFIYALMKNIGALLTELLCVLMICSQATVIYCIWNYMAFSLISNIDNMFAASLKDFPLKEALAAPPKKIKGGMEETKWSCGMKVGKVVYKMEKYFYTTFYYYFMAYSVIFITAFLGTPYTT